MNEQQTEVEPYDFFARMHQDQLKQRPKNYTDQEVTYYLEILPLHRQSAIKNTDHTGYF